MIAARVNNQLVDLQHSLTTDATVEWISTEHLDASRLLWHSSAHIMAAAVEDCFPGALAVTGPATFSGFFYDMLLPGGRTLNKADCQTVQQRAAELVRDSLPFERLQIPRAAAERLFAYNRFKISVINRLPPSAQISVYRCGEFVDLCSGPHIPHTGVVKALHVQGAAAAVSRGGTPEETTVQRIYGISFFSAQQEAEWRKRRDDAAARDHRTIGQAQQLWMHHKLSPGGAFFLPHGMRILTRLQSFLRSEYARRGYQEVDTPQVFARELWEQSGHWTHYQADMFGVVCGHDHAHSAIDSTSAVGTDEKLALKPMNCPSHCLIFDSVRRSYRELPMRVADFGALHRNESRAALSGLTRLRRFHQDDAHIFCAREQLFDEVLSSIRFLQHV